ncbi:MAG: TraM recognition domain-containing protein [Flavobacterium lindanitolerans]|uniref:type IV secretory system conjugative DNA transfer family protein n=1 Tax=Flavobacterium lindanitolerans TaxID=428988 RepID=UPI001A3BD1BA|nr:TraM recognition domain-containing protein [Flavobacterium lindanitolerans]MBL7867382.1 TraM recognition domain-containing protein [Flavobacterium lindanitolerans]
MNKFELDEPITFLGPKKNVPWTIGNSVEGVQIFGGIGSGKTSGSGRFFALKYLSKGYGGLVLTVKPDEKDAWVKYCESTNRLDDLIIVEPKNRNFFNFIEYESTRTDGKNYSDNILQVLKTVMRASEEKATGKNDDPFWENASDMLISNTIDLCLLAYDKVTMELLYKIARSVPKSVFVQIKKKMEIEESEELNPFDKAMILAIEKVHEKTAIYANKIPLYEQSLMTPQEMSAAINENVPESRTYDAVNEFFLDTYMELSEKTRSIVEFSFTGFLFRFLKEPVYGLFCNKPSTFSPEDCLNGKIIIINLPVKMYHKVGRDAQIMFKYIWQRAMERRPPNNLRPVFQYADEAQHFLHEHDTDFQATARSSRIATVYLTQNLPNYYANMGGIQGHNKVKSFLGTLATKIFHANADIETNGYASDLIGEAYEEDISKSTSQHDGNVSTSSSVSHKLVKIIRPERFHTLLTGGKKNDYKVTGVIQVQGMSLLYGFSYDLLSFNQLREYK